ncbi:hypothetical protein ACHAWF_018772 [Thalassiosira exigua]
MSQQSHGSEGSFGGSDVEGDYDDRVQRNRERNRMHAKMTRVRKKEQLQALKARVNELEEEGRRLKQSIKECSVASILLGLSTGSPAAAAGNGDGLSSSSSSSRESTFGACLVSGKRKRFMSLDGEDPSPPPMELNIKGQITLVGGPGNEGKSNINWKTGVYVDEKGKPQQLTKTELESLRRERNRMHAKMTRDRKKCFIASLKRVISKLEEENMQLRETLERSCADERLEGAEKKQASDAQLNPMPTSYASASMFGSNIFSLDRSRAGERQGSDKKLAPDAQLSSMYKGNTSASMFDSNIYTVG